MARDGLLPQTLASVNSGGTRALALFLCTFASICLALTGTFNSLVAIASITTVVVYMISRGEFGWGGRIRTFTVLINSEVSYQLDHAPAGDRGPRAETARCAVVFAKKRVRSISLRYHEAVTRPTARFTINLRNLNQLPRDRHQKRGVKGLRVLRINRKCERREQKE